MGETSAAGRSYPRSAGEGADLYDGASANEADERSAGAAEGRGVDVAKRSMRAAGVGVCGAGGGKGLDDPGRVSPNAIVG